jgi:hypothetical protein
MHFSEVVDELNQRMVAEYSAVDAGKNPISVDVGRLGAEGLEFVLQQYSLFSKNISSFLLDAYFVMAHEGWTELADELTQNIQEEFGREPGSHLVFPHREQRRLPHYVLLRRGLKEGLGVDVASVPPSPATRGFIFGIRGVMNDLSAARVAGGAYALESSAVPELRMVYGFAKRLFAMRQKPVPRAVTIFFESHIDELEVGHEQRLKQVCGAYIKAGAAEADFKSGFLEVMAVMDRWWEGLYGEITRGRQYAA